MYQKSFEYDSKYSHSDSTKTLQLCKLCSSARSHIQNALDAISDKDYETAEHFIDEAFAVKTESLTELASLYYFKAILDYKSCDTMKALEDYDSLSTFDKNTPLGWLGKCHIYIKSDELTKAKHCINSVFARRPSNPRAWDYLGHIYKFTNDYDSSLICFENAIRRDSLNPTLYHSKATLFTYTQQWDKALVELDRALELAPEFDLAWNDKTTVLLSQGLYDKALVCSDSTIKHAPDFYIAWNHRGLILYHLENYAEAITALDSSLALNPNYNGPWYNKGLVSLRMNEKYRALDCFRESIELNIHDDISWTMYISTLAQMGLNTQALASCDTALIFLDSIPTLWLLKGTTFIQLNKPMESIACFDRALQIDTANTEALNFKAMALGQLARYNESLIYLVSTMMFDSTYYGIREFKGLILQVWNLVAGLKKEYGKPLK